jgi:hypothetical protein
MTQNKMVKPLGRVKGSGRKSKRKDWLGRKKRLEVFSDQPI